MLPIGPPQTRMKLGRPVAPEIGHEATGLDPRSSPGRPILTLRASSFPRDSIRMEMTNTTEKSI
jgi:hypothetical protein